MSDWVKVCMESEAPQPGAAAEFEAAGVSICVANVDGTLRALDNWCPHRRGPLGQGWVEGNTVVCPWHAWAFDAKTGDAQPPENAHIAVFPIKLQDGAVLVNLT